MIAPHVSGRILEVGAGRGTYSTYFAEHGHLTALEPSEVNSAALRERLKDYPNASVITAQLDGAAAPGSYDTVVLLNVLEHIPDDHRALGDIYESLAPGGKMVLWVPAFEALYGKFDQQIGHYRRYRHNQLLALVHKVGFQQVSGAGTPTCPVSSRGGWSYECSGAHPPRVVWRRSTTATSSRSSAASSVSCDRRSVSRCWSSPSGRRWRCRLRFHRSRAAGIDRPRAHIAALDGLRGLAVIAVLFFHAGKLQGGFLGVDLFFALSGFLITSLLLTEVDLIGRVRLVAFWGRRFRRLLPAVLLLLVAVTVITTVVASVPERAATLNDGPWAQAYVANWHAIAGHRDYWASFELPRMFGHLWSLAIEEQFYLVWPMVVGLIAWRSRHVHRTVIVVCIVASLASLLWMIRLFDPADPTRVYIGTDTRASSLLLGALFAAAPLRSAAMRFTAATR